jgi:hypothetical protein
VLSVTPAVIDTTIGASISDSFVSVIDSKIVPEHAASVISERLNTAGIVFLIILLAAILSRKGTFLIRFFAIIVNSMYHYIKK